MPQSFSDTYDLYRSMQDEGSIPQSMGLKDFSGFANDITGTQDYNAGKAGLLGQGAGRLNYWITQGLNKTGLPEKTGELGAQVFKSLGGSEEAGRQTGEGFVQGTARFLPAIAGGFVGGPVGAGLALMSSGLLGAQGYDESGGGVGHALFNAAMPLIGGVGGKAASAGAEALGLLRPVAEEGVNAAGQAVTNQVLRGVVPKAVNLAAHGVGSTAALAGGQYALDAATNKTWTPYAGESWTDYLLGQGVGALPYMLSATPELLSKRGAVLMSSLKEAPAVQPQAEAPTVDPYQQALTNLDLEHSQRRVAANRIADSDDRQAALDRLNDEMLVKRFQADVLAGKASQPSSPFTLEPTAPGAQGAQQPGRGFTAWTEAPEVKLELEPVLAALNAPTTTPEGRPDPNAARARVEALKALKKVQPQDVVTPQGAAQALGKAEAVSQAAKSPGVDLQEVRDKSNVISALGSEDPVPEAVTAHANDVLEKVQHQAQLDALEQSKGFQAVQQYEQMDRAGHVPQDEKSVVNDLIKTSSERGAVDIMPIFSAWQNWRNDPSMLQLPREEQLKRLRGSLATTKANEVQRAFRVEEPGKRRATAEGKFAEEEAEHRGASEPFDPAKDDPDEYLGKQVREELEGRRDEENVDLLGAGGEKLQWAQPDREGNFRYLLAPYDAATNTLGGKHKLSKEGRMSEKGFTNVGAEGSTPVNAAELALYKQLVPEAFKDGMVDVPKLVQGLKEKGPQPRPLQESGMRLHYDQTIPHAMEKLTGGKGESVDLGLHDKQSWVPYGEAPISGRATEWATKPGGSPVFRDASGNPKTQITGRAYSLDKVPDQFTLTRANMAEGRGQSTEHPTTPEVQGLPSFEDMIRGVLKGTGYDDKFVNAALPWFQSIRQLMPVDDVRWGSIVNDLRQGKPIAGLASTRDSKVRRVLMSAAETGATTTTNRELGMVLSHELLGHVVDNLMEKGALPPKVAQSVQNFRTFLEHNPTDGLKFLQSMREILPKEYRDLPIFDQWLDPSNPRNLDPNELYANASTLWAAGHAAGAEPEILGLLAPSEARSWLKTISQFARRMFGAIKSYFTGQPTDASDLFKGGVHGVIKMFDQLSESMQRGEHKMDQVRQMLNANDQMWTTLRTSAARVAGDPSEDAGVRELGAMASGRLGPQRNMDKLLRGASIMVEQLHNIGQRIPAMAKSVNEVQQNPKNANRFKTAAVASLVGGTDVNGNIRTRGPEYKDLQTVRNNGKIQEWINNAGQWLQHYDAGEYAPKDQPDWQPTPFHSNLFRDENAVWSPGGNVKYDLQRQLQQLPQDHQGVAVRVLGRMLKMAEPQQQATLSSVKEQNLATLMTYLAGKGVPRENIEPLARNLYDSVVSASSQDPATQQAGQQQLAIARGKLGNDDAFARTLDLVNDSQAGLNQLQVFYAQHPNFLSLIRSGDYHVTAFDPKGKQISDNLRDMKDYAAWQAKMRSQGFTRFEEPQRALGPAKFSMNDQLTDTLRQVDKRNQARAKSLLDSLGDAVTPEQKEEILGNYNTVSELANIGAAQDITMPGYMRGFEGGRKMTPGSQNLLETQQTAAGIMARSNANRITRGRMAFHNTDPELRNYPDQVAQVKQMLNAFQGPDSKLASAITKLNAVYTLGGMLPTYLNNMFQSWVTTIPEMVARGDTPMQATSRINRAAKAVAKFSWDQLRTGFDPEKDTAMSNLKDNEQRALFKWLKDEGLLSFGALNELSDPSTQGAIDLRNFADKGTLDKLWDSVKAPVNVFAQLHNKVFAATEHFNVRVAALAALEQAREQMGNAYTREEAFPRILDAIRSSTFHGGRVNRPLGYNKLGLLGPMAYSLQQYTMGWLGNLARYVQHWKGGDYLNLTPAQRLSARNAAMTQLGLTFASAGALGLPFFSAALKGLEGATGMDLRGRAHVALSQLLDDDSNDGGGLADVIMNGAANAALASAGVPVDLGSRFAVGGVLGINDYDGFSGDSVFGPTGNMVSSVLAGLKSAQQGDTANAAKYFAPPFLKKAVSDWLHGGVTDAGGRPVQVTDAEDLAYMLGFTPQTLKKLNQYKQYAKQRGLEDQLTEQRETNEILGLAQEDPQAAAARVQQIADESNGVDNVQGIASRVAKAGADKRFPVDVRETMNKREGDYLAALARSLGVTVPQAHEAEKTSYEQELMQLLGGRPGVAGMQRAGQEDELGTSYTPFSVFQGTRR